MAKKPSPKNSEDALMAAAGDGITYTKAYQKVSDLPSDGMAWLLPKDDYRNACYVWQVPNGEVTIPGSPLYRMPCRQSVLTSDFGFMPSDTFEDFGVFAVSDCSDWQAYAQKREKGEWKEEEEKIEQLLQDAVPVAPAPTPSAVHPSWDWSKVSQLNLHFSFTPLTDALTEEELRTELEGIQRNDRVKFYKKLFPSLDLSGNVICPQYYVLNIGTSQGALSAAQAFFSGADAEVIKEECQQAVQGGSWIGGNGAPLVQAVIPASAIGSAPLPNGKTLDASAVRIEVQIADCVSTN